MSTTLSFVLAVILAIFLFVLGAWLVYEGIVDLFVGGVVTIWGIMVAIVGGLLIVAALYVASRAT